MSGLSYATGAGCLVAMFVVVAAGPACVGDDPSSSSSGNDGGGAAVTGDGSSSAPNDGSGGSSSGSTSSGGGGDQDAPTSTTCGGPSQACCAGNVCKNSYACQGGQCVCGGLVCGSTCVDPKKDKMSCGGCGHVCDTTCTGGLCEMHVLSTTEHATSLALDFNDLFISHQQANTIVRCSKITGCGAADASAVTILSGGTPTITGTMAVGTSFLYFVALSDGTTRACLKTGCAGATILIANDSGNELVASGTTTAWANAGGHVATCTDNCATAGLLTLASAQAAPDGIALSNGYVYWANNGTGAASYKDGSIQRRLATGADAALLIQDNVGNGKLIAVDSGFVYFSRDQEIDRCPITGCGAAGPQVVVASEGNGLTTLAVDATSVYWGETSGRVRRCPASGCGGASNKDAILIAETPTNNLNKIVLDDAFVYVATNTTGTFKTSK